MDKESQGKQKFEVRIRISADGQTDPPPFLLDDLNFVKILGPLFALTVRKKLHLCSERVCRENLFLVKHCPVLRTCVLVQPQPVAAAASQQHCCFL